MSKENPPITTMLGLLEALYIDLFNHRKTGARVRCYPQEQPKVRQHFDSGRGHSGALSTETYPLDRDVFQEALVREYVTGVLEPGCVSKIEFKITEFGIRELPRLRAESEKVVIFTVAQVTALCGGKLPYGDGFAWERVEHFMLEDGVLQPYAGDNILPGPGIYIETRSKKKHSALPELMEPYDWWNYSAPVCPPEWVRKRALEVGYSIDWQNTFHTALVSTCIFYRTRPATKEEKEDDDDVVTHVLPGSYEVSKTEWLRKISDLDKPLPCAE